MKGCQVHFLYTFVGITLFTETNSNDNKNLPRFSTIMLFCLPITATVYSLANFKTTIKETRRYHLPTATTAKLLKLN